MLQYSSVNKGTLELLKSLMQQDFLSDFNLAGGTALALQIGHRISVDLDLFTDKDNPYRKCALNYIPGRIDTP